MPPRVSATADSGSGERADQRVDEWRTLLDRHARIGCALEKSLQNEHGLGLSEFEILDRLVDGEKGKYRMSDLASDIYLSQSALSRAVARLEEDGLVRRDMCTNDRRAIFVCLTDAGRKVAEQARPTHRAVLEQTWT
ncbi:DNA-binding MarR family transcriptional regulator [Nocardioides thalensis]|uniref:DNA-binding MarR family transcriptional regulator n=1 Tax=Nocardioides thalensis TaxID=1914755 RepID=A0A853BXS9_9ACTN|nr:MarR family transcriptional regulator [Nocardioides thalensis]NYI99998.1 DNA-binding MarR family transcriptional regulator [Nocardioides thalensis]